MCQQRTYGTHYHDPEMCQQRTYGTPYHEPEMCLKRIQGTQYHDPEMCQQRTYGTHYHRHCVYTVIKKKRKKDPGRILQASVVKTLCSLCVFTQGKKLGYVTDVQNITEKRLSHCVYTVITKTRSG